MLEEIIREIDGMVYLSEGIGCGLEDAGITDWYEAAAYGFQEATERILEILRSHNNDGWIYCGDGKNLPKEEGFYLVTLEHENIMDDMKVVKAFFYKKYKNFIGYGNIVAWRPLPFPYRLQKSVGGDYRQQIMERFLKVE